MSTNLRPEHPFPQRLRSEWQSLNGPWNFAFDPELVGEQNRWFVPSTNRTYRHIYGPPMRGKAKNLIINVPFPWESKLSGVERTDFKGAAWYEREFDVPAEWAEKRVFLNFGAVDWHARIWVNGQYAAENDNGYLPFSIELGRFVQPGESAIVTVRALDVADANTMVGKQVPRWYTYSSGIWQSVWLEARAQSFIENIRVIPDVESEQATVACDLVVAKTGDYTLHIRAQDNAFPAMSQTVDLKAGGAQQVSLVVPVPEPQRWSPESPFLYDFTIDLISPDGDVDQLESYFGMRTVSRAKWGDNDYEYVLLNGEPVYLRGALDQAFHPDGLHAYPSDDVIRGDIQLAKDLGLNMLRCHIKINDPRYYYWADRLGLLIMYDIACADLDTPEMRRMYEAALPEIIARDFNSPSIFAWVLFNETWGLTEHHRPDASSHRWVAEMVEKAKELDSTRLVEDNSPCHYDHVVTDINSWHYYINDYPQVRKHIQQVVDSTYPGSDFNYVSDYVQGATPLMNSEYGGIAARTGDLDISWCFKYQTSELRRHAKICGYVYTELDDIEWEHNGFVNYDRSAKEFGYDAFVEGMTVADLNGADFVGVNAPPCKTVKPGTSVELPIFVSHWGSPMTTAKLDVQLDFIDRFGETQRVRRQTLDVQPVRFDVVDVTDLVFDLPDESGLATVGLVLHDGDGNIRARNYVNLELVEEEPLSAEQIDKGWAIHFLPSEFTATSWNRHFTDEAGARFSGTGSGWVEYQVPLPATLDRNQIQGASLKVQLGARAGMAKVDWPQKMFGRQYPQTHAHVKTPSDVTVSVNGIVVDTVRVTDDPADARGVLSHHADVDPGAYGYLMNLPLPGEALAVFGDGGNDVVTIRFEVAADAEHRGGMALYAARRGRLPVDPMLLIETSP